VFARSFNSVKTEGKIMAINTPKNEQKQQDSTTMGQAFAGAQQASQEQPSGQQQQAYGQQQSRGQARPRLADFGRIGRSAMSRSPASDVITKLNSGLVEVYKGVDKSYEVTLIPIDLNNTRSLEKSAIVVAVRDLINPDVGVAYHTLVLEASSEPVQSRFEMIGNQNTEILRVTGDVYNATFQQEVSEWVARQFPGKNLIPVDAEVVPEEFDVENGKRLHGAAANAITACTTELEMRSGGTDIDLGNVEQDNTLTVQMNFAAAQTEDVMGLPVRSDIMIDFRAGGQPIPGQPGVTSRVSTLSRISGFMDLVWVPAVTQQQAFNPWVAQQQAVVSPDEFKRYIPRFVMTDLESMNLLTIRAQLLALVPAFTLRENNSWVESFRPSTVSTDGVDWKDIGAVGIEANFERNASGFGSRIDTKSDAFQRGQNQQGDYLIRLVASVFQPKLLLSLDVPEVGPSTWSNSVFAAAGEVNNPNSINATEYILKEADKLTHGRFLKYFPQGARVTVDENNRIHTGYYVDRHGQKRDLREVDYLAVLNMVGDRDPELAREWSDSFALTGVPLEVRLAKRKSIITGILGANNVHFKGFARRVTFEPQFVDALIAACKEVGLSVRTIAPFSDLTTYERAINPYATSAAMDASGYSSGIFNRGYPGQQQATFGARSGFSRWDTQR
jgi:hypothetical protein